MLPTLFAVLTFSVLYWFRFDKVNDVTQAQRVRWLEVKQLGRRGLKK